MTRVMTPAAWEAHQRLYGRDRPVDTGGFEPFIANPPRATLGSLLLVVPIPPSVNEAWILVMEEGKPKRVLAEKHRDYRRAIADIVAITTRNQPPRYTARLELDITLIFANARRCDIDNRIKPLQDAMTTAGVYIDDSQIDELLVHRRVVKAADEHCLVEIRELAA